MHQDHFGAALVDFFGGVDPVGESTYAGSGGQIGQRAARVELYPAIATDAADQIIQGVNGFKIKQAIGLGRRRITANGQSGTVAGKIAGQFSDQLSGGFAFEHGFGQLQHRAHGIGGKVAQRRRTPSAGHGVYCGAVRRQSFLDNDVGQAHGQQAFGAGLDGNPAVGVGRGQREARIDVNMGAPLTASGTLTELTVAHRPPGGRDPGGQEIRPKRQQVIGVGDVKVGQQLLAVNTLDRRPQGRLVQRLKPQMTAAKGLGEPADNQGRMSAHRLSHHQQTAASGV